MDPSKAKSGVCASNEVIFDGFVQIKSVNTTKGRQILLPMRLGFPEGQIYAILGPNGSGKTTFLNTIAYNIQSNIRACGEVNLPGSCAFVPQDDQLHGFYTCEGYLQHYARLAGIQLTPAVNDEIHELLQNLGLVEQANTTVGDLFLKGLSGGQKRRLSIALEALTKPKNLFLDEPTFWFGCRECLSSNGIFEQLCPSWTRTSSDLDHPSAQHTYLAHCG